MLRIRYILAVVLAAGAPCFAQEQGANDDELMRLYQSIRWEHGPTTSSIGSNAQIKVPEGFQFTDHSGAQIWNQITQNPPDSTQGLLMPSDDESS